MDDSKTTEDKSIVEYLNSDVILDNIRHTLGTKTPQFIASVASLVSATPQLKNCDRRTLLSACLIAANLDLPINPSLGFAYVIPYNKKEKVISLDAEGQEVATWTTVANAQFQMGYKGFIQLAMRSGQFKTLNVSDVREGEIGNTNRLTGEIEFSWAEGGRDELPIIGFVAYMRLVNGFEKSLYMTTKELERHAGKYSASYKYNSKTMNLWRDEFGTMASKTVIKLLLSRYAPMTTEMQTAQLADQAIITDDGMEYVDNEPVNPVEVAAEKEKERIINHIHDAKTIEELELCADSLGDATELIDEYDLKIEQLRLEAKNVKK